MLHDTPLRNLHQNWLERTTERDRRTSAEIERPGAATGYRVAPQVEYISYGPRDAEGLITCEVPSTFGEIEAEYAAIRRGVGLLDCPHRGTLRITGSERINFLNRMVTQELKDLTAGEVRTSFWLNRQGRIVADLLLADFGDLMLADLDIHQAETAAASLDAYLFAEDVELINASAEFHHVALHGPRALDLLAAGAGGTAITLDALTAMDIKIDGCAVQAIRRDQVGDIGIEVIMNRDDAPAVFSALLNASETLDDDAKWARPIGWFAYNTARIEGGTPLFNIDFGSNSLPAETGLLDGRVSFRKGCYLGQEIVARMASRNAVKQRLIGLRIEADLLPVAEGQVFVEQEDGSMGDQVGVVTSSTLSPMLGAQPIAFAMIRSSAAEEGQRLLLNAEGAQASAVVSPLPFWSGSASAPNRAGG